MFTPPADDVKPIPVPDEIYTQCITDAARYFGIDAELVFTLFDNEGGKVGTFSRNTNGTYDIGPMQINSSNLPEIKKHFPTVTWRVLAYDACASFWLEHGGSIEKLLIARAMCLKGLQITTAKPQRYVQSTYLTSW